MSQRRVNETSLTATADALRAKLGTSDPIPWVENEGFKEAVESIQTDSGGADVSGVTATETEVLENAIFVDAHGEYKEGTIPRNGDTSATFDGIETKSVEIPAGYTTGGTVALDGAIDNAVEAAKTSLANKGVEVPTDTDVRGLAGLIDSIPETGSGGGGDSIPTVETSVGSDGETVAKVGMDMQMDTDITARTYPQYYLFNGVRLPEFPFGVIDQYPYRFIRKNTTSGYYEMYCSVGVCFFVASDNNIQFSDSTARQRYRIEIASAETATTWEDNGTSTANVGIDDARPVLWASHNIPNGSADATDIYFEGTEPVPVE